MPFFSLKTGIVHTKKPVLLHRAPPARLSPAHLYDGSDNRNSSDTCDVPLCEAHARQIGPNKHLCPSCHQSQLDAQQQRGLFTSLV